MRSFRILSISSLVVAAAFSQASPTASLILGINDNGLYQINVITGTASMITNLAGTGSGQANAVAYDNATKIAYFQRGSKLWKYNTVTNTFTNTNVNIGSVAGATFANGKYIYGTGTQLKSVDVVSLDHTVVGTYNKGWGFGDLAYNGVDKIYGSSGNSFFSVDTSAGNTYASVSNSGKQTQLAFVGSSLYGVATGNAGEPTGRIFSINTSTGAFTNSGVVARLDGTALALNDAATLQAVPEPGTMAALGLGAAAMLRRRRQRNAK